MRPLAIIPARIGSRGIPNKNWTPLAGMMPVERAVHIARGAGCRVLLTTDHPHPTIEGDLTHITTLHGDLTPMITIVKDALAVTSEDCILLVQPTQLLRTTGHLIGALRLLTTEPRPDSVVSLVEVPVRYHPLYQISTRMQQDMPPRRIFRRCLGNLVDFPARRQDL